MARSEQRPVSELEDMELVERANGGEYEAFEELVRRYQDKAYRLAWSMVKDDSDAQDVVQDAFLNVYRKLDTFEGNSRFGSWIYRVVVNSALMKLRKRRRRSEVALESLDASILDAGPHHAGETQWPLRADEAVENQELRQKIIDAVDELEPKYQTVFVLREVEGLNLKEIADVLELSVPAVKSRLHRARLFLRATLERYLSD